MPSVVLEAMDAGLPVVGFENAGGFEDLLAEGAGVLARFEDTAAFAQQVSALLRNRGAVAARGARGREIVSERFGWTRFVLDLTQMADVPLQRVSVIVPNFNCRCYLPDRLESIAAQTYPIYELIVLDDASTDGSRDWLEQQAHSRFPEARLVFNDANSGGAFRQWRQGVQLAAGDMVWIAEADDLCAPDFLRSTVRAFDDSSIVLSYCQSQQMREDGGIASPDYLEHVADLSAEKWRANHVADGKDEVIRYLAVKNTIPNVSGVLFRRQPLAEVMTENLDRIAQLRIAGDWLTYILCLERGRIAFHPCALNFHRRHAGAIALSTAASDGNPEHLREILAVQRFVADRHHIPEDIQDMARRYAREVFVRFGLDGASKPTFADLAASAPVLSDRTERVGAPALGTTFLSGAADRARRWLAEPAIAPARIRDHRAGIGRGADQEQPVHTSPDNCSRGPASCPPGQGAGGSGAGVTTRYMKTPDRRSSGVLTDSVMVSGIS